MEKLHDLYNVDIIDWSDLDESVNHPYVVARVVDILDEDYNRNYLPLHTLRLVSFDSKLEAYKYCLANGLSRDSVLLRY